MSLIVRWVVKTAENRSDIALRGDRKCLKTFWNLTPIFIDFNNNVMAPIISSSYISRCAREIKSQSNREIFTTRDANITFKSDLNKSNFYYHHMHALFFKNKLQINCLWKFFKLAFSQIKAYSGCYLSGSYNYDLFSTSLTNAMILKAGFTNPYGPYATGAHLAFDSNMTNDMCMNFCLSNGFFYSGTIQK